VVWRLTGDRVLVRHVGRGLAADLVGAAALVWIAAEHAATADELAVELGLDRSTVVEAVEMLDEAGWVE